MNLIKPKRLKKGDTIAIIATSGDVNIEKIDKAKSFIESLGYNVKLGQNIFNQKKYLAGTDEERLSDLHWAFNDKNINAILCARGGYGAIRLINKIDYELIKSNPKIFCGYSDITALNTMISKNTGLVTFLGAMAQSDFAQDIIDEFTINSFFDTLTINELEISATKRQNYNPRNCEGVLFGGNLSTLTSLCGQDFIPNKDFILIAEDLNEPVYKIDRYLTQLFNIDKFKANIKGIIIGEFLDIDEPKAFEDLLEEISNKYNLPIFGNYPISHNKTKATVPIGAVARIENETIKIKDFTVE